MDEDGVGIGVDELEALRARAAEAEESSLRALEAERQLAFARAGVDTESEAGRVFARGYDGDLSTEAVKEVAAGFFRSDQQRSEPSAQDAMAVAAQGPPPAPEDKASAYAKCQNESELMAMATQLGTPTAWNRPAD